MARRPLEKSDSIFTAEAVATVETQVFFDPPKTASQISSVHGGYDSVRTYRSDALVNPFQNAPRYH